MAEKFMLIAGKRKNFIIDIIMDIQREVRALFAGKASDETVLDYVCGILEDEDFEFGDNGDQAYEAIGPFLVGVQEFG
jgi:hypothetical protein